MSSSRYFFDTEAVADFAKLCERFTGKTLQSPYRSTVPLLSLAEHSLQHWNELLKSWGAPQGATVHFEYCVASPKKNGNPSQTDALIFSDSNIGRLKLNGQSPGMRRWRSG